MMTSMRVMRSVEVVVIMLFVEQVYWFPVVRITTHMFNTENEYTRKHYLPTKWVSVQF